MKLPLIKITRRKIVLISVVAGFSILSLTAYRLLFPGIPFLLDYKKTENFETSYTVKTVRINAGGRTIPAKIYTPADENIKSTVLLVHGVHNDGFNESRLIHFTATLAHSGFRVVTPDIVDLKNYHIVDRALTDIELTAKWLAADSHLLKKDEPFALWGISFAGGLCLSIAASQQLRDRISSSFSFGGHGDLDSTMHYLMTGHTPQGEQPPHVYGQAVLVRRFADKLVPKDQVVPLRETIYQYLRGHTKKARAQSKLSPPESRKLLRLIFEREVAALGKLLLSKIGKTATSTRLSAVKGPAPACAVHLLHGSADNVIPPDELFRLKRWAEKGDASVYSLVSSLINHVELEEDQGVQFAEYFKIIRFWNELLRNS